jgi:hypothetical protein
VNRTTVNTGAGVVGAFSLFAIIIPGLFKLVGWIEWAQGLSDVLSLFSDPRIHWQGIYLLAAFAAAGVLVANNLVAIQVWQRKRHKAKTRTWNLPATEAINYLATNARIAASFSPTHRYDEAVEAFSDAARTGRYAVAGRPMSSGSLVRLTPKDWESGFVQVRMGDGINEPRGVREVWLISKADQKTVLMRGLIVDSDEFAKTFT